MAKENRYALVFLLGLENSHYFLSQSVFKLKSIVPWSRAFSRASGSLFVVCCLLFSYFEFLPRIDYGDSFGFGFATISRKLH